MQRETLFCFSFLFEIQSFGCNEDATGFLILHPEFGVSSFSPAMSKGTKHTQMSVPLPRNPVPGQKSLKGSSRMGLGFTMAYFLHKICYFSLKFLPIPAPFSPVLWPPTASFPSPTFLSQYLIFLPGLLSSFISHIYSHASLFTHTNIKS